MYLHLFFRVSLQKKIFKMKKINLIISGIAVSVLMAACSSETKQTAENTEAPATTAPSAEMALNLESSNVRWEGTMMGMYSHFGNVKFTEGNIKMEEGKIVGGKFVVDMSTIVPTDENYDAAKESTPAKLVGHLASPDFFDVQNYSNASFEITGSEGNTVTGNLTIRGITNPETVQNVVYNEETKTFKGSLTFDRTKYDVAFKHPVQEMVLSNDVKLDIELVANN